MKKVVMLLTNPFRPDPRVYKEAKTLIEGGYDVTIVAWDREGGYPKEETIDSIVIHRISIKSTFGNFFSFITKLPLFWLKTFSLLHRTNFDIIHCHDFDTLPLGVLICKMKGKKAVYDAHENYSGMISGSAPSLLVKWIDIIQFHLVKKIDRIIVANREIGNILQRGSNRDYEVVMNCQEIIDVPSREIQRISHELGIEDKFTLLYVGVLEKERFLLESIEAVKELENMILAIGGFGSLESEIKKRADGTNIKFLGKVQSSKVPIYTAVSDALICIFDPKNKNNVIGTPNKLFEAMAAGKSIIVTKDTLSSKIVTEEECGLAILYNTNSFKEAVIKLRDDPTLCKKLGQNGLRAAKEKYNWKEMSKRLLRIYDSLVDAREFYQ